MLTAISFVDILPPFLGDGVAALDPEKGFFVFMQHI